MTFTPEEVRLVLLTHPLHDIVWEKTQLKFPRVIAQCAQHTLYEAEQQGVSDHDAETAIVALLPRMAACPPVTRAEAVKWAEDESSDWVTAFIAKADAHSAAYGLDRYHSMLAVFDAFLTHLGV